jgi:hypothetical protein
LGRVLKELGIQSIVGLSPQAKGRIERLWGTFQDRLVSELRLAGAATLEEASQVLETYQPRFNARFAVPPAQPGSAYRPAVGLDLAGVLCFKHQRTVAKDNTIRLGPDTPQLLPGPQRCSYAPTRRGGGPRTVGRQPGGLLSLLCPHEDQQGTRIASRPAPPHAVTLRADKRKEKGTAGEPGVLSPPAFLAYHNCGRVSPRHPSPPLIIPGGSHCW